MSKPRDIALAFVARLTGAGETANLGRLYRDADLASLPATTVLYSTETRGGAGKDHREVMALALIRQARVDGGDYMEIGDISEALIKSLIPVGEWTDIHPAIQIIEPVRAAITLAREDSNIVEARVEYRAFYVDQYGA